MDKAKNAIKCNHCQKIFTTPVLLPCNHSICKVHAEEAVDQVTCPKCGESHQNQRFPINTELQDLIDSHIGSFDFGPCHKEAKDSCNELEDILGQIDVMIKDPIFFSHQAVDQLKHRVLLKSEQLKFEIDENTKKLLVVLSDYQRKCEQNCRVSLFESNKNKMEKTRNETEKMLNKWLDFLNQLKFEEAEWKSIKNKCDEKIKELKKERESFKKLILIDEYEEKRAQVDHFYNIDINPQFIWKFLGINSEILNCKQKRQLLDLCEICPQTKWTLLWRGSRDGFGAKDFHTKCDNIPNTLTVIKTTQGKIFGGYTKRTWSDKTNGYARDPSAYIFSLVNDVNYPLLMKIQNPKYAIFASPLYGPIFGYSHDICIYNNSNMSLYSYARAHSYCLPENLKNYPYILAGSYNFQVDEIEVFQLE